VGKLFTAVTIAKLVEQGRLAYADPIGKWIPEYPNATAARTVTVAHLLTHSSGIADFFRNPEWERADKAVLATLPLEAHFRFFAADSLAFVPGSRSQYSNSGFLLLGIIAERAAKQPYASLFAETAFRPADMRDSWNPERATPRATGYTWYGPMRTLDLSRERIASDEPAAGTPAGGGISTIGDMTRFAAALLDGRLISRASLDTLTSRHGIDETPTSWAAYGFDGVELWRGVRIANKSGNTYGTHTQLDVYPDAGYAVVVLSNVETWASEAVVYKARELITRR
jgi:CubicO group peptidase (beta-lactamase class C family)